MTNFFNKISATIKSPFKQKEREQAPVHQSPTLSEAERKRRIDAAAKSTIKHYGGILDKLSKE